ncbi:MAG: Crp/Fnr family transcriptional regulator [Dactylosporangium sp.]|nr:Crp/Fnr family transcriptional regulator [Dactylosporangium sp.]NNJ62217.1 Crp/Fnr family transcriptional regulator [Dactylosporangium sp.]
MTTASDLLAAHPFLVDMPEQHLLRLSYWCRRAVFQPGTRLFNEGSKADRFWLIREGEVRLDARADDDGDIIVETVGAGRVLGWSWMFPPYRWRFGATAMSSVLAIECDATGIRGLCDADADLGYDLTRRMTCVVIDRLQSTRMRLLCAAQATTPDQP